LVIEINACEIFFQLTLNKLYMKTKSAMLTVLIIIIIVAAIWLWPKKSEWYYIVEVGPNNPTAPLIDALNRHQGEFSHPVHNALFQNLQHVNAVIIGPFSSQDGGIIQKILKL
jgi:hypothetical protein